MNQKNAMQVIVCLSLFALMMPAASAKAQSGTYYYVDDYFKENFEDGETAAPPAPQLKSGVMMYVDSDAFHAKFGVLSEAKPTVNELVISPGDTPKAEELAAAAEAPVGETADGKETVPVEVVVIPLKGESVNVTPKGELIIAPEVVEPEAVPEVIAAPEAIAAPAEEPSEEAEELIIQNLEAPPLVVSDAPTGAAVVNATGSNPQQGGAPLQIVIIGALVVVIVIMLVILLAREEPKKGAKQEKKSGKEAKATKPSSADWQEGDFLKTKAVKKDTKPDKPAEKPAEKKPAEPKQEKKEVKPFLLKIRDES